MQIRLTVALGSRTGGRRAGDTAGDGAPGAADADEVRDVLVTAPSGTPLSAVTAALASAVAPGGGGQRSSSGEAAVEPTAVYAGTERLDPHRQVLGEPPLLDGAVVTLHGPAAPSSLSAYGSAKARLHVVAGPDAGGVHLLQGGTVRLGRSAEADVPLDDPDVSRLHCAVTVTDGGAVTVTDLGSTNGTVLGDLTVGPRPVLFRPGTTLRLGESAVRLEVPGDGQTGPAGIPAEFAGAGHQGPGASGHGPAPLLPGTLPTQPDGQGRLRLTRGHDDESARRRAGAPGAARTEGPHAAAPPGPPDASATWPAAAGTPSAGDGTHAYVPGSPHPRPDGAPAGPEGDTTHGSGYGPGVRAVEPERPRGRGLSAWARRFSGGRTGGDAVSCAPGSAAGPGAEAAGSHEFGVPATVEGGGESRWPDPAAVLLTALGPGPRIWERGPGHPDAMTVRLGTAHRSGGPGGPVTVDLRGAGALGLAGPRARLAGLARSVIAQLAALHGPSTLEIVLLSADRSREAEQRAADWSWLGWLPHLRPAHGQDCRLLTAYDREQAAARTAELLRALDEARREAPSSEPARSSAAAGEAAGSAAESRSSAAPGSGGRSAAAQRVPSAAASRQGDGRSPQGRTVSGFGSNSGWEAATSGSAPRSRFPEEAASRVHAAVPEDGSAGPRGAYPGPYTLLVVDGDPGSAAARDAVFRLAAEGAAAGIHVLCLADTPAATPVSPLDATIEAACEVSPAFRACGALGLLSGAVATAVRVVRPGARASGASGTDPESPAAGGPVATVDAVSAAWAERFARALAPLREPEEATAHRGASARAAVALPETARLLDELGLSRATPAALQARWAEADGGPRAGRARLVFGAGPHGPVEAVLRADRGHVLISGAAGAGKTELLRSLAASLAAGERPDRLRLVLLDGAGAPSGDDLRPCLELPHAEGRLQADDPGRMREFAQWLSGELKRRLELIGPERTYEEYAQRPVRREGAEQGRRAVEYGHAAGHRTHGPEQADRDRNEACGHGEARDHEGEPAEDDGRLAGPRVISQRRPPESAGDRPAATEESGAGTLPRLVVLADDFDVLVDPALGNPGRPAAGSIVRSLEAVAREGARLGVHLIAATGRPKSTAETAVAQTAALRAELTGVGEGGQSGEESCPGRGRLTAAAGEGEVPSGEWQAGTFQAGRITGRIPRTSTLRPTVVPLDWLGAGDPPTRRPVRELGNGPTDLALLASAIARAAQSLGLPARASAGAGSVPDGAQDTAAAPARAAGAGRGARESARED